MTYRSNLYLALSYVYYVIWTDSLRNLCIHMSTLVSHRLYEIVSSLASVVVLSGAKGTDHKDRCKEEPTSYKSLSSDKAFNRFSNVDSRRLAWCLF